MSLQFCQYFNNRSCHSPWSRFQYSHAQPSTMEQLKHYKWSGSVRVIQHGSSILTSDDTACTTVSFVDTSHWHQRWIDWYIKMWYNDLLVCSVIRLTCKLDKDGEYSVLGFELCVNLRHVNYWWLNMIPKMNDLRVCSNQNRELKQLICKSFLKIWLAEKMIFNFASICYESLWVTGQVFGFCDTGCQHPWAQP